MTLPLKLIVMLLGVVSYNFLEVEWFRLGLPIMLIIAFGIPHGATDHLANNFTKTGKFSTVVSRQFLIGYLSPIVLYTLVWLLAPQLSLVVFLAISAYHFGETQIMASLKSNSKFTWLYASWGGFLLSILFFLNPEETQLYLNEIIGFNKAQIIKRGAAMLCMIFSIGFILSSFLLYKNRKINTKQIIHLLLDTFFLCSLLWFTDLLFGFAIFFACWHSYDAILLQITGFKEVKPNFNFKQFYFYAAPFTIISLLALSIIFYLFINYEIPLNPVMLFFVFISVITLPHMLTIKQYYNRIQPST